MNKPVCNKTAAAGGRCGAIAGALSMISVLLFVLISGPVAAADGQGGNGGITVTQEITVNATTIPEGEAIYLHRFTIPFLRGDNPLTAGNNVVINLRGAASPVHIGAAAEAVLTPAAFFQLAAGSRAESGWSINLFGGDINGIGLTRIGDDNSSMVTDGSALDGLILKSWAGAAVQFNFAAIFPGDWNHVVMRSYHEINYAHYTRAAKHESWWQPDFDHGEDRNGPSYYGNLLIGYQMPARFKMAGLIAEGRLFLHDTPGREMWGDDRMRWIFAALTQFALHEKIDLAVLAQLRTMRNFRENDWKDRHFMLRTLDDDKPLRLEFYRAVAVLTYKI